jgi:hypothetical protein
VDIKCLYVSDIYFVGSALLFVHALLRALEALASLLEYTAELYNLAFSAVALLNSIMVVVCLWFL